MNWKSTGRNVATMYGGIKFYIIKYSNNTNKFTSSNSDKQFAHNCKISTFVVWSINLKLIGKYLCHTAVEFEATSGGWVCDLWLYACMYTCVYSSELENCYCCSTLNTLGT